MAELLEIATVIAIVSGIAVPLSIFLVNHHRTKVSKELDIIRDILKDRQKLEKHRMEIESKRDLDRKTPVPIVKRLMMSIWKLLTSRMNSFSS